jgi:hypothetical protein
VTTTRHEAPEQPHTLQDRFRDAIAPRTLLLGVGVLLLLAWVIGGAVLTLAASAIINRAHQ